MNIFRFLAFAHRTPAFLLASILLMGLVATGTLFSSHPSEAAGVLPVSPPVKTEYSIKNDACFFSWDCLWNWQRNLRKIVGEHQIGYPSLGRVEIVTPDVIVELPEGTNHIDYGLYLVHVMRTCKNTFEETGLRSDAGETLRLYLSVNPHMGDSGYCCTISSSGVPTMVYSYRSTQSLEDEMRRARLPTIDLAAYRCTGGHELAHWFTLNTDFGWFLNEGFAVYMDYSLISPERRSPYRCYTNGYQAAPDTFFGSVVPYIDLHLLQRPYSELTIAEHTELIYARYCFWKNIEQRYGQSTVISIVNQQRRATGTTFVNNFSDLLSNIQTAIIPVVGDDFYAQLAGFGIYPADFATVR